MMRMHRNRVFPVTHFILGKKTVGVFEPRTQPPGQGGSYFGCMFVRAVSRFKVNGQTIYCVVQTNSDGDFKAGAHWFNVPGALVSSVRRARKSRKLQWQRFTTVPEGLGNVQ